VDEEDTRISASVRSCLSPTTAHITSGSLFIPPGSPDVSSAKTRHLVLWGLGHVTWDLGPGMRRAAREME
jgi:hypothetical protein